MASKSYIVTIRTLRRFPSLRLRGLLCSRYPRIDAAVADGWCLRTEAFGFSRGKPNDSEIRSRRSLPENVGGPPGPRLTTITPSVVNEEKIGGFTCLNALFFCSA